MTSPYGGGYGSRSLRPPQHEQPVDPLTDSAVHRGMRMGTLVRFHLWGDTDPLDVHLLDLVGVNTWAELEWRVRERHDLTTRPPRCIIITGNAIRWAELVPDEQGR